MARDQRRLAAIVSADFAGYSRLMGNDESGTLAALKAHVARVLAEGAALSTRDLKVNGKDLMRELALQPGRIIGEILDALLEVVTNDPAVNEREALLVRAREILDVLRSRG